MQVNSIIIIRIIVVKNKAAIGLLFCSKHYYFTRTTHALKQCDISMEFTDLNHRSFKKKTNIGVWQFLYANQRVFDTSLFT